MKNIKDLLRYLIIIELLIFPFVISGMVWIHNSVVLKDIFYTDIIFFVSTMLFEYLYSNWGSEL